MCTFKNVSPSARFDSHTVTCEFAFLRSRKVRFASCAVLLTSLLLKRRPGCIESIESPSESQDDVFAPTCRGLQHVSSAGLISSLPAVTERPVINLWSGNNETANIKVQIVGVKAVWHTGELGLNRSGDILTQ